MLKRFLTILLILIPCLMQADAQSDIAALDKKISECKKERAGSQMKADVAGQSADRIMQQDWMQYRHELKRQESLQQEVADLDEKIADFEKQKQRLEGQAKKS